MEESFAKLFQSSHLGVVIANAERVVDANDAFLRMVGFTREELQAGEIDWRKLTPPEFANLDRKAIEHLRNFGVAVPFEKAFVLRDGSRLDFIIGAVRLSEEPFLWACYTIDLTETKRLREAEREFLARQKVVNQLAHELNNPLAAVTLLLHLARTTAGLQQKQVELLDEAMAQLNRVSATVREVLAVTKNIPG
ncbi:MAG: PAS domain S-box protein [Acidobacteriota bacterium]